VLDDWRDEQGDAPFPLSDPLQMERFFGHHFFARKGQMDYAVKAQRDDTLLQMFGENGMAVAEAKLAGVRRHGFMQSFASASKEFRVIDGETRGLIVPYNQQAKELMSALSASHDIAIEFQLLRKAQQFAVNVFEWEMDTLKRSWAIYEVDPVELQSQASPSCSHRTCAGIHVRR
jgi:CRISPR-associated endonuclease/helicase Cas3